MKRLIWCLLTVLLFNRAARADLGASPLSIEKITAKADVIVKATALKTELAADADSKADSWFEKVPGFGVFATRFKVVSVLKGDVKTGEVVFRHYARYSDPKAKGVVLIIQSPPCYYFTAGQSYLLWAGRTEDGNLRQLWSAYSGHTGDGAIRVGDAVPVRGEMKNIVWDELTKMAASGDLKNVRSAISVLSPLCHARSDYVPNQADFKLAPFVKIVRPFIESPDANTAFVATRAVQGAAAPLLAKELARTAANHDNAKVRGAALQALSEVQTPEAEGAILRALDYETSTTVLRTALWAMRNFPGEAAHEKWRAFAKHPNRALRQAVAEAIGWSRDSSQAALLDKMIDDNDETVSSIAARNLIDLTAREAAPFWKKRRTHQKYGTAFTVALAEKNIKSYLADLCAIARQNFDPETDWNMARRRAWQLLLEYVGDQPLESVNSPHMKLLFDALEASTSDEEAEELYSLYVNAEMKERAAAFRRRMTAKSQALGEAFKRIDAEAAKK